MNRIPERISTMEAVTRQFNDLQTAESPLRRPARAMLLPGMLRNVQSPCRSNQEPQADSRPHSDERDNALQGTEETADREK
jgi:hypothetical protein